MARIPVYEKGNKANVVDWALIDDDDLDLLGGIAWKPNTFGYLASTVTLHRMLLGLRFGDGRLVDHINRNRLDNRRENLRIVTASENCQNRAHIGGSSPHRGVTWNKASKKWQAQGKLNGKHIHLGLFEDEIEAGRVAWDYRAEHMPCTPPEPRP